MTDEEKFELVIKACRDRAAESPSPQKEIFEFYAEILPAIEKMEKIFRERETGNDIYLHAFVGAAASFVAHGLRNACGDDADEINRVGPQVTAMLSERIQIECFNAPVIAVLNRKMN